MTEIPKDWQDSLTAMLAGGRRVILGIAGTPGAGKSSLVARLAEHLRDIATVVPMDGYHLANIELSRLGLSDRKGAPNTFDAAGYVALLQRIRADNPAETVYAPVFKREIEEPIAGAIPVLPQHRLILTEGNYLLLQTGAWQRVRPLLDACWFVDITAENRLSRLVSRHMQHGRSEAAARHWIATNDALNADLIEQTRPLADRIISWPPVSP
jgi:pantothenate kinase